MRGEMKKLFILASALFSGLPLVAQMAEEDTALQATAAELGAVGKAIEQISFITEHKPNPHAEYYVYLHSSLWCGPCRREMPKVIAEYEAMRQDNRLEVILVSHDNSVKSALQYLDLFSAPFAAVLYKSAARKALPGCAEDVFGIPTIVIVNAQGKELFIGHASEVVNWKKIISADAAKAKPCS